MGNNNFNTNVIIKISNKWNNTLRGYRALEDIYHKSKSYQTIILHVTDAEYMNLSIAVLFQLLFDRIEFLFENEVLGYKNEIFSLHRIYNEIEHAKGKKKYEFFNRYSKWDEETFSKEINDLTYYINNQYFLDELHICLHEIFNNAIMHGLNKIDFGKFSIYYGAIISDDVLEIVLANNGTFIPIEIQEKLGIEYDRQSDYINKAFEYGFSTREDDNGGLGLHVVNQFSKAFNANLVIISGKGYIQYDYSINRNNQKHDVKLSQFDFKYTMPCTMFYFSINLEKIKDYFEKEKEYNLLEYLTYKGD